MHDSLETARLTEIIKAKKTLLQNLTFNNPGSPYIKELNGEITFLQENVLPLLLMKSTVFYNELAKFTVATFRKLEEIPQERRKFVTGIVTYFEFKRIAENEIPVICLDSNVYLRDTDYLCSPTIQGRPAQKIIMQDDMGVVRHPEKQQQLFFVNPYSDGKE